MKKSKLYAWGRSLLLDAKLRGKRRPVQIVPEKSPLFRQIAEKTLENKRKTHCNCLIVN